MQHRFILKNSGLRVAAVLIGFVFVFEHFFYSSAIHILRNTLRHVNNFSCDFVEPVYNSFTEDMDILSAV